jgi:CheY-like chemotaxis protein
MEAMGFLAVGIAHDFNNVLAAIASYSESVQSHLAPDDPLRSDVSAILKVATHGSALTRQLLAFSKPQLAAAIDADVGKIIDDLETLLRWVVGRDVDLTIVKDADLWRVRIDPGHVDQILINLCTNARDAMPAPRGGTLRIELFNGQMQSRPCVMLSVSDTGFGMDEDTLARAFEPFFTTKGEKGNGLGLATVWNIVKQYGGEIGAHSELGRGTTFSILLPAITQAPPVQAVRADATTRGPSAATVLLADDQDAVRLIGKRALERAGFTVLLAADGADALSVAATHQGPIDVLVADVSMPRVSGIDVARRLRHDRPNLRVIYVSGYPDLDVDYGTVLPKPFTSDVLTSRVREELRMCEGGGSCLADCVQ